jgi:formylglycine-generating enzyme required for sulfatase activity
MAAGATQSFTVTADSGQKLKSVTASSGTWAKTSDATTGVGFGGASTWQLTMPASNVTITAEFEDAGLASGSYTAGGVSFDMVLVPGGTTTLNSKSVTLDSFTIGKYEVTQGLWEAVMGTTYPGGSDSPNTLYRKGADISVYYVSWEDIVGTSSSAVAYTVRDVTYYQNGFCYQLSQQAGGGKQFRLPTEAEWEYAAKGGQQTHNYTYSGSITIGEVAWYNVNSYDLGTSNAAYGAHKGGLKAANELGLYDMSGNVYEWCGDWYNSTSSTYPSSTNNPTGYASGSNRVARGGSWDYPATRSTVAYRYYLAPSYRYYPMGFRLVLSE